MTLKKLPFFTIVLFVLSCGQSSDDNDFKKAKKLNDKGKFKEAISILNPFIKRNPHFDSAYIERSYAYVNTYDFEKAIIDYNHLIATPTYRIFGLLNRGNSYASMGEYKKAIDDYNRIIEVDSMNAQAYYYRAVAISNISIEDDKSDSLFLYPSPDGYSYYDFKRALSDLNKAIQIDSTVIETFIERGNLFSKMKMNNDALMDFNKSVQMDTTYYLSYISRGLFYANIKAYELALKDFNKSIALNPTEPKAYIERGFFYLYSLKNKSKACEDFAQAKELGYAEDPDWIDIPCKEEY